jgi:hypothetical protein
MSRDIKLRTLVLYLTDRYALTLEQNNETNPDPQKILIQKKLTMTVINQLLGNKVPKRPAHKIKAEEVLKSLCICKKEELIVEGKFNNFDVPITEQEMNSLFKPPTEKTIGEVNMPEKILWTTKRENAADAESIAIFKLYIFITTIQHYCTEGTAFLDEEEELLVKEFISQRVIKTENFQHLKSYSGNYGIRNIIQVLNNKLRKHPVPGKTFEGKIASFYFASGQPLNIQHHELEFELRKVVRISKRETMLVT